MLDRNSPTWVNLRAKINERIEKARDDLESPTMDMAATENLRGEIVGLRWVIATVEQEPPKAVTPRGDY